MSIYEPKGNSYNKSEISVYFDEKEPPDHLSSVVHRYLNLRTNNSLKKDYTFHALPDACTYIVFDQLNPQITGVTKLKSKSEELNLGKNFSFVNIRLFPGVWQNESLISQGKVDKKYEGPLPLIKTNNKMNGLSFEDKQNVLTELVEHLIEKKLITPNFMLQRILKNIDEINSVKEMADCAHVSPRHLQRTLRKTIGLAPHDFLKILRLQETLALGDTDRYADQSHFIRSFRSATGLTPGQYAEKYEV